MKIDKIPFLDLAAPHRDLRHDLVVVFETALNTSQFVGGGMVHAFEQDFTASWNAQFCIAVSSGSAVWPR